MNEENQRIGAPNIGKESRRNSGDVESKINTRKCQPSLLGQRLAALFCFPSRVTVLRNAFGKLVIRALPEKEAFWGAAHLNAKAALNNNMSVRLPSFEYWNQKNFNYALMQACSDHRPADTPSRSGTQSRLSYSIHHHWSFLSEGCGSQQPTLVVGSPIKVFDIYGQCFR